MSSVGVADVEQTESQLAHCAIGAQLSQDEGVEQATQQVSIAQHCPGIDARAPASAPPPAEGKPQAQPRRTLRNSP